MSRVLDRPVTEIFIDYSRIGLATTFRTPVRRAQRLTLRTGDVVVIQGDDVPDAYARVAHVDATEPEVAFEFLAV